MYVVGNRNIPHMRLATYGGEKFGDGKQPFVHVFGSAAELEKYMRKMKVVRIEPLTLNVKVRYHYNWAHTTFDGLYAAFVGAAKFHRHREPYLLFLDSHNFAPPRD
eukprot:1748444-Amphidinium_carterae.1